MKNFSRESETRNRQTDKSKLTLADLIEPGYIPLHRTPSVLVLLQLHMDDRWHHYPQQALFLLFPLPT
jgi:hypothetical protein